MYWIHKVIPLYDVFGIWYRASQQPITWHDVPLLLDLPLIQYMNKLTQKLCKLPHLYRKLPEALINLTFRCVIYLQLTIFCSQIANSIQIKTVSAKYILFGSKGYHILNKLIFAHGVEDTNDQFFCDKSHKTNFIMAL